MKNTLWGLIETDYPTFAEWLYDYFLVWCQEKHPGEAKDEKAWFNYLYETHIPKEIAERLGLERRKKICN